METRQVNDLILFINQVKQESIGISVGKLLMISFESTFTVRNYTILK